MDKQAYLSAVDAYIGTLAGLKGRGLGAFVKTQAALLTTEALERLAVNQDENPFPELVRTLEGQGGWLASSRRFQAEHTDSNAAGRGASDQTRETISLFEAAWTTYSDKTYDHSVELIRERLARNGFDREFFRDKVCFDGGCGTGRFSVAMAELGAKKVVAADLGGASLEYLKKVKTRFNLDNIEVVQQDVTDLGRWPDGTFDFVVSNGVLHHAVETERGIREHFRVTRPGGVCWIYLYGAGGIYWDLYDRMKEQLADIPHDAIKDMLARMEVREGLIYTFLDNVKCPIRKYYLTSQVIAMLRPLGVFTYRNLKGNSVIDDTDKVLASGYGKDLWGPEGEVRIRVDKP